jgi:hypothetical protein
MRQARLFALLLASLIFLPAQAQEARWVASWGTATTFALHEMPNWVQPPPADSLPPDPPPSPVVPVPATFVDQSVRMIVRSSVGGSQLRLQFANTLGAAPTRLGAVSDPVDLAVPALTELAVSIYLPDESDTRSSHELALNTTFVATGNVVDAEAFSTADTNRSYFWLTGLEVMAAPPCPVPRKVNRLRHNRSLKVWRSSWTAPMPTESRFSAAR